LEAAATDAPRTEPRNVSSMTNYERWALWISAAGAVTSVGLFVGLGIQLRLLRSQIAQSDLQSARESERNRRDSTFSFITATLGDFWTYREDGLPSHRAQDIAEFLDSIEDWSNSTDKRNIIVQKYLSNWETLATAINLGAFDVVVVARLRGDEAVEIWRSFGRWIVYRRQNEARPGLYTEIEELAHKVREYGENHPLFPPSRANPVIKPVGQQRIVPERAAI